MQDNPVPAALGVRSDQYRLESQRKPLSLGHYRRLHHLGGRGIPLMMWSYRKGQYDGHLSRNHCEQDFIRHLRQLLPKDDRIILIADRGFAGVSLFQWLIKENIPFIIRAPRTVNVRSAKYSAPLSDLHVHNGEAYSLGSVQYTRRRLQLPNLVVARQQQPDDSTDPWFLAINLPLHAGSICRLYARRMIIEQDFREAKSHLNWSDSRIRKVEHYQRLTTIILVTLVFATLVGRIATRRPTLTTLIVRRRKGSWDHNYPALGLELL
jgi:transposase